jgi:phosphate transport system protein
MGTTAPPPDRHRRLVAEGLGRLRVTVAEMGERIDQAIVRAMIGLMRRDVDSCRAVVTGDAAVNALHREVRDRCVGILSASPLSCELRETMSLLDISSELERMGDHCVSIAKIAQELADLPERRPSVDLSVLGRVCREQIRDVLTAVVARDAGEARRVAGRDDCVDRIYHRAVDDLIQLMSTDVEAVYRAIKLVLIARHLERIGDRVTNVAEDLVFVRTGVIEELG